MGRAYKVVQTRDNVLLILSPVKAEPSKHDYLPPKCSSCGRVFAFISAVLQ